jgi:uncharacterized protein (DUF1330 family)
MNRFIFAGLGIIGGIAIGAGAMHTLHAQSSAPAYYVSQSVVKDQASYAPIQTRLREHTKQNSGGKFLTQAGKTIAVEGEPGSSITIVQFKSMDEAKKFYLSPEMKRINDERRPFVTSRSALVEGLAN